jgi:hypothetical protein
MTKKAIEIVRVIQNVIAWIFISPPDSFWSRAFIIQSFNG